MRTGQLGEHIVHADRQQPGIRSRAVGVADGPPPKNTVLGARWWSPRRRGNRAEQDYGRRPQGRGNVGDACIAAHNARGRRDDTDELENGRPPSHVRLVRERCRRCDSCRDVSLPGRACQDNRVAFRLLSTGDRGPAVRRPAACRRARTRMQDRRAARYRGRGNRREVEVKARRVRLHAGLAQQPAPAMHLVFALQPSRVSSRRRDIGMLEGDEPQRARGCEQRSALGSFPMEVHRDVGVVNRFGQRFQRRHRHDRVHGACQPRDRFQPLGAREQTTMFGMCVREGAQGRNRGEQVAQAERAEH